MRLSYHKRKCELSTLTRRHERELEYVSKVQRKYNGWLNDQKRQMCEKSEYGQYSEWRRSTSLTISCNLIQFICIYEGLVDHYLL